MNNGPNIWKSIPTNIQEAPNILLFNVCVSNRAIKSFNNMTYYLSRIIPHWGIAEQNCIPQLRSFERLLSKHLTRCFSG